ncbi:hypothetical protein ACOMICROBIO_GDFFDHBD_03504 [Vibrio sp. B1REV9]|uniref:hypothetical protein n=1 Tax=Vibrio sp. B1REV9 TaxID=2751179 RepID=UPI001B2BF15F|nr:hypothetical protein [Vibrio sp. B1REV9]CAE6948768.1 hypothetical protein ACOMICROBIO_GDFFDHBD_03504 [Vibrio sp. B1REV9]
MQTGKTILTSYFEWKGHDITVQCSMLSGKEWVYVDDVLVSEKRNWRLKSSHPINIENDDLEIQLHMHFFGAVAVYLIRDKKCVDEYKFGMTHRQVLKGISIAFVSGLFFGLVATAVAT